MIKTAKSSGKISPVEKKKKLLFLKVYSPEMSDSKLKSILINTFPDFHFNDILMNTF